MHMQGAHLLQNVLYPTHGVCDHSSYTMGILFGQHNLSILQRFLNGCERKMRYTVGTLRQLPIDVVTHCKIADFTSYRD